MQECECGQAAFFRKIAIVRLISDIGSIPFRGPHSHGSPALQQLVLRSMSLDMDVVRTIVAEGFLSYDWIPRIRKIEL